MGVNGFTLDFCEAPMVTLFESHLTSRCSLRVEADQRVIVVGGLPVHHYRAEDAVAEAYAMVFRTTLSRRGFGSRCRRPARFPVSGRERVVSDQPQTLR
jgi:hypothetical protein